MLHSYCYRTGDACQERRGDGEIHIIERNKGNGIAKQNQLGKNLFERSLD